MASFAKFPVQNKLTQTQIDKAYVSTDSTKIILIFNKPLANSSTISDITISSQNGIFEIDSFSINKKVLTLYFMQNPINKDDVIKMSYTGVGMIGDDGIVLDEVANVNITNNSKYTNISSNVSSRKLEVFPNPNSKPIFNYYLDAKKLHELWLELYKRKNTILQ